jgi:hypothetical protein
MQHDPNIQSPYTAHFCVSPGLSERWPFRQDKERALSLIHPHEQTCIADRGNTKRLRQAIGAAPLGKNYHWIG